MTVQTIKLTISIINFSNFLFPEADIQFHPFQEGMGHAVVRVILVAFIVSYTLDGADETKLGSPSHLVTFFRIVVPFFLISIMAGK